MAIPFTSHLIHSDALLCILLDKIYNTFCGGGDQVIMRVTEVSHIHYDNPIPVYDIINANPYHNFLVKCDHDNYIVSHNC